MSPAEMLECWFESVAILLKTKQIENNDFFGWSFLSARDGTVIIEAGDVGAENLDWLVELLTERGHSVVVKDLPPT